MHAFISVATYLCVSKRLGHFTVPCRVVLRVPAPVNERFSVFTSSPSCHDCDSSANLFFVSQRFVLYLYISLRLLISQLGNCIPMQSELWIYLLLQCEHWTNQTVQALYNLSLFYSGNRRRGKWLLKKEVKRKKKEKIKKRKIIQNEVKLQWEYGLKLTMVYYYECWKLVA